MCFNKNDFLLLLNSGFSLFFQLLDNLATHITWPLEEDLAELCEPPSMDLSNTMWAQKDLTMQTARS